MGPFIIGQELGPEGERCVVDTNLAQLVDLAVGSVQLLRNGVRADEPASSAQPRVIDAEISPGIAFAGPGAIVGVLGVPSDGPTVRPVLAAVDVVQAVERLDIGVQADEGLRASRTILPAIRF